MNDSNPAAGAIERSGGELLAQCLLLNNASQGFGVPGESYLAVLDALYDIDDSFDLTVCRNEGGAAYMAAAYGALTGKPGLCFVTRGPGATNAAVGVHSAAQNSAPMIMFVGQVGRSMMGREAFQEIDYGAFFGSVAKWVVQIEEAERIPELLARAFTVAQSGRPGPVVVALPEDVLTETTTKAPCAATIPKQPVASAATLDLVVEKLNEAKKPVLLLGGRDWLAAGIDAVHTFAENNRLPVVTAFRFNDLFDNLSDCYCGNAGVGMPQTLQNTLKEADLVLALGVRFGEISTLGYTLFDPPVAKQKIIHVHASDQELGKVYVPEVAVQASPGALMEQMLERPLSVQWSDWCREARDNFVKELDCPAQPGNVDMGVITTHLREVLPDDVIVTNGAGNFTAWPNRFLTYGRNARLLAPQNGTMGYGLPAAIAAKKVLPEATVVCFAGDGDFQMNCQELGTAMHYNALPIVLIVNNGSYGTIRMHQEATYPNRPSATDIINPDYVALAGAYGMHGEVVDTTEAFEAAFARARESKTGALLDIRISLEALTPARSLSDIRDAALSNS